jgi:hypothetical protein
MTTRGFLAFALRAGVDAIATRVARMTVGAHR